MNHPADQLHRRLMFVARRFRSRRRWQWLASIAVVAAAATWWLLRGMSGEDRAWSFDVSPRQCALLIATGATSALLVAWAVTWRCFRDPGELARRIEARFPSLDQRLLTAVSVTEQASASAGMGYLQQRIVHDVNTDPTATRWYRAVSGGTLWASRLAGWVAMVALVVLLTRLTLAPGRPSPAAGPLMTSQPARGIEIQPGDTQIERGTGLVITARFGADLGDRLPESAELICAYQDGTEQTFPMRRNLDDAVLGAYLSVVDQPLSYRVRFDDRGDGRLPESRAYQVEVFDFPALVRGDARLDYPEYTKLQTRIVQDTLRVAAVEGTRLRWDLHLNKPVASAVLQDKEDRIIRLEPAGDTPQSVRFERAMKTSGRYQLLLTDADGRRNKDPVELVVRVLPNQPPELKVAPPRDVRVSALEELDTAAKVSDDYGVSKVGLSYRHRDQVRDLVLSEQLDRIAEHTVSHQLKFEELQAQPDELLTYYYWAEDIGPDGQPRRVESDMFLAEVRPFEEIFREGQPPPGGQPAQPSQNGQQAEELAELQKQIINATWTLIRRVTASQADNSLLLGLGADIDVVADSQETAKGQLDELAAKLRDQQSRDFAAKAGDAMQTAHQQLKGAAIAADLSPRRSLTTLREALTAAQDAYQNLLRLRGREFQVVRSRSASNSGGGAGNQNRQQRLDELELDNEENRYEQQQQATPPQEAPEQRETRQVLNRLRELAQRQQDLNKQLAQIQSAIQLAETEEEKEQLRRQLERLREQQEQMLRETDELAQRMQTPENQQRMADASEKLEQTRENVRRANEALQQGDASQALSAGKRAEREFEEMRDRFREEAAGEFAEQMRQMRDQAQKLEQTQQELTDPANTDDTTNEPGLRQAQQGDQDSQRIRQQREQLDELLQQMEDTVGEAEVSEPLLAQKLYDSYRETKQRRVDQKLADAEQLQRRGFTREAQQLNRESADAFRQLREGVEDAAESVLGDPAEGLKRAADQLERLDQALRQEWSQQNESEGQRGERQEQSETENQPNAGGSPTDEAQPASRPGQAPAPESGGGRESQQRDDAPESTSPGGDRQPSSPGLRSGPAIQDMAGDNRAGDGGGGERIHGGDVMDAPLTGEGFREWSDGLRDVEEMVSTPELRARASQIRDRAREMRRELHRHAQQPQWDLVDELIATPLQELLRDVREEWMRETAEKHSQVPVDRDPVPAEFGDAVRRYYENLGSDRP